MCLIFSAQLRLADSSDPLTDNRPTGREGFQFFSETGKHGAPRFGRVSWHKCEVPRKSAAFSIDPDDPVRQSIRNFCDSLDIRNFMKFTKVLENVMPQLDQRYETAATAAAVEGAYFVIYLEVHKLHVYIGIVKDR